MWSRGAAPVRSSPSRCRRRRREPRAVGPAGRRIGSTHSGCARMSPRRWASGAIRPQPASRRAPVIDFRPALIDPRLFPLDVFRRVSAQQLRALGTQARRATSSPQGNQGNYHLRAAITRHIALTRAVVCRRRRRARHLGRAAGLRPARARAGRAGRDASSPSRIRAIRRCASLSRPPARNSCRCRWMPRARGRRAPAGCRRRSASARRTSFRSACRCRARAARRCSICAQARRGHRRGRLRRRVPLRRQRRWRRCARDAADVVFYVGTFSKCMLPSLRLGFVVAPPGRCPRWSRQKTASTGIARHRCRWASPHSSARSPGRHVRRMRHIYKQRRQLLLNPSPQTSASGSSPFLLSMACM